MNSWRQVRIAWSPPRGQMPWDALRTKFSWRYPTGQREWSGDHKQDSAFFFFLSCLPEPLTKRFFASTYCTSFLPRHRFYWYLYHLILTLWCSALRRICEWTPNGQLQTFNALHTLSHINTSLSCVLNYNTVSTDYVRPKRECSILCFTTSAII